MPAPVVANASDRGDTRYDINGLTWDSARGAYVDDAGWHYDSNGLSLDRPNAYDPSRPAQNDFNEQTGQYGPGGGSAGGGGGDPYDSYIQQLKSMLDSQSAGQSADTKAAIQQALIAYGVVPQGFQDKFGALDDTTRALIQKNTDTGISGYARMLQDKEDAQRQMLAGLSAKGLRRSGAKGWLGRRAQLNWDRQSADATNALLSDIGGKTRAFADAEQQRKMQLLQALAARPQTVSPWQIGQASLQAAQQPQFNQQSALQYWQSNPAPTYTSPTSGKNWYGGFGGLESTPFAGKAQDGLS